MVTVQLRSEQDTALLAARVAQAVRGGLTVGLVGDLGSGKTTFVRHLVKALGGDPSQVASPTFTLQHEYRVGGGLAVDHWDLYRLQSAPLELLEPPDRKVLRVIEWPDRCPELQGGIGLLITLTVSAGEERSAVLAGEGADQAGA